VNEEVAVVKDRDRGAGGEQSAWRKSSWSTFNGNCVEVTKLGSRLIGVRDTKDVGSKDVSSGPVLVFDDAAWRSFLDGTTVGG
jgi:hypothetical protein